MAIFIFVIVVTFINIECAPRQQVDGENFW